MDIWSEGFRPLNLGCNSSSNTLFSINLNSSNKIKPYQTISNHITHHIKTTSNHIKPHRMSFHASTSTLFGGKYLEYIKQKVHKLFSGIEEIILFHLVRPVEFHMTITTEIARIFLCTNQSSKEVQRI